MLSVLAGSVSEREAGVLFWRTNDAGIAQATWIPGSPPLTLLSVTFEHVEDEYSAGTYSVKLLDEFGVDQLFGLGDEVERETSQRVTIRQPLYYTEETSLPSEYVERPHVVLAPLTLLVDFGESVTAQGIVSIEYVYGTDERREWGYGR